MLFCEIRIENTGVWQLNTSIWRFITGFRVYEIDPKKDVGDANNLKVSFVKNARGNIDYLIINFWQLNKDDIAKSFLSVIGDSNCSQIVRDTHPFVFLCVKTIA